MNATEYYIDEINRDGEEFIKANFAIGAWGESTDWDDAYDGIWCSDNVCDGHTLPDDSVLFSFLMDSPDAQYAIGDFGITAQDLCDKMLSRGRDGRKWLDASIRCYLLSYCADHLEHVFDDVRDEYFPEN